MLLTVVCWQIVQLPVKHTNVATWYVRFALLNDVSNCFVLQTTIMAVEYAGGVVIGADSRTTTGYAFLSRILTAV